MSYFSKFGSVFYGFFPDKKTPNNKISSVTNITTRIRIASTFNKEALYDYDFYRITDSDRPDTIANDKYGNPSLHWVILLFNEFWNPLFEWPRTTLELNEFIDEKYKGSSLFLNIHGLKPRSDTRQRSECRLNKDHFDASLYAIDPEKDFITFKKDSWTSYRGRISSFDQNLGELRFLLESNDFPDEEIQIDPTRYEEIILETTSTVTSTPISVNILGNSITLVTKTKHSLHHFEKNEEYLYPLLRYSDVLNDSYLESTLNERELMNGTKSLYDSDFCFSETLLGTYLSRSATNFVDPEYVFSNQRHEYEQNEKRRELVLPRADSISTIMRTFNALLREG